MCPTSFLAHTFVQKFTELHAQKHKHNRTHNHNQFATIHFRICELKWCAMIWYGMVWLMVQTRRIRYIGSDETRGNLFGHFCSVIFIYQWQKKKMKERKIAIERKKEKTIETEREKEKTRERAKDRVKKSKETDRKLVHETQSNDLFVLLALLCACERAFVWLSYVVCCAIREWVSQYKKLVCDWQQPWKFFTIQRQLSQLI